MPILAMAVFVAVSWVFFGKAPSYRATTGSPLPLGSARKWNLSEDIVGKWVSNDRTGSIEFFADGSVAMRDQSKSLGGRWTVIADDRIKITSSALGSELISTIDAISISGRKMAAIADGEKVELTREEIAGPHSENQGSEAPPSAPSEVQLPPGEVEPRDQPPPPAVEVKTSESWVWTDIQGRKMQAKLLDVKRDDDRKLVARFEKGDGKTYTIPVDQLATEDRKRALKKLGKD